MKLLIGGILIMIVVLYSHSEAAVSIELSLDHVVESEYSGPWYIESQISAADINCMALNIYFEARGEPLDGQYAVAEVVMNRVMHDKYPNTICGVVKAGIYPSWDKNRTMPIKNMCAFEWFCDRKPDEIIDGEAFEAAKQVANNVVNNADYVPILGHALFYHAAKVTPYWVKDKNVNTVIGNHVFYY